MVCSSARRFSSCRISFCDVACSSRMAFSSCSTFLLNVVCSSAMHFLSFFFIFISSPFFFPSHKFFSCVEKNLYFQFFFSVRKKKICKLFLEFLLCESKKNKTSFDTSTDNKESFEGNTRLSSSALVACSSFSRSFTFDSNSFRCVSIACSNFLLFFVCHFNFFSIQKKRKSILIFIFLSLSQQKKTFCWAAIVLT